MGEQEAAASVQGPGRRVFRGRFLAAALVQFVVLVVAQALAGLLWTGQSPEQWLTFATIFVVVWTLLTRTWLRVSDDGLVAGSGPLRREHVPVADVVVARQHLADRRAGERARERHVRDARLHQGWGPAVTLERRDGSQVVVGVDDSRDALTALEQVGVPVSGRSG